MTQLPLRIGITFNHDEGWVGGSYYIFNVISALALLPLHDRPEVVLISNEVVSYRFMDATGFDDLYWLNQNQVLELGNRLHIDLFFPHPIPGTEAKTLAWIPDFQDKNIPEMFSEADRKARTGQHLSSFRMAGVVFSSQSVANDAARSYPGIDIRGHVVPFATFNQTAPVDLDQLRHRLGVPERYIYCPNQFWKHKNHGVLIEAAAILKSRGVDFFLCFSGKEHEPRFPGYVESLKDRVAQLGLSSQVTFLGFLTREDQLTLLANAELIVQPSLSEGWSTVIEDAKLAQRFVVASDIPVHHEQLTVNRSFFDPHSPEALADRLEELILAPPVVEPIDYRAAQLAFGETFMTVARAAAAAGIRARDDSEIPELGVSPSDTARRAAEARLLKTQTTINLRQAELHDLQTAIEARSLEQAELFATFENQLNDTSQSRISISKTLSAYEVGGLGFEELPVPELNIAQNFYWVEGRRLVIRPRDVLYADPTLVLDFRLGVPEQVLEISLDGGANQVFKFAGDDLTTPRQIELPLGVGKVRVREIMIHMTNAMTAGRRTLGMLLTRLDIASAASGDQAPPG